MKTNTLLALICLSLLTPTLFGQTNAPANSTDAANQNEQQLLQLQNKYPELIKQLEGSYYVGSVMGLQDTLTFSRNPVDLKSGRHVASPYLWAQGHLDTPNLYQYAGIVIPTSATTFWITSSYNPTDLSDRHNNISKRTIVTLSQNGRTLTEEYGTSDGRHHMDSYTKKQ